MKRRKIDPDLKAAEDAIKLAQATRAKHRRRTRRGDPTREADIALGLLRIQRAMKPIRTTMGRFPYDPPTDPVFERYKACRDLSERLQSERRKLWKMKDNERSNDEH